MVLTGSFSQSYYPVHCLSDGVSGPFWRGEAPTTVERSEDPVVAESGGEIEEPE